MTPKVSVIIPCYNQGDFLFDSLQSVRDADSSLLEVIIVNDGSTDERTNKYCRQLQSEGYHVIFQENKGLSAARNTAIAHAKGEYILPLDADNKIRPGYITKGIEVLDSHPNVGVVYGNAAFFGEREGIWKPGPFNLQRIMISNTMDACAMIRRSVLDKVGVYDTAMRGGWEDWEMWLRIAFAGYDFYYVDEVLFDYRVTGTSMSNNLLNNYERRNSLENYVHEKHASRMGHHWMVDHYVKRFKKNPLLFAGKLFLRAYFPGWYNRLLKKNKIVNGL